MRSVRVFLIALVFLTPTLARAAFGEDRLTTGPIAQKDCACISILPDGGTLGGRASFNVINSCGALDVSVGFAGDIARVAPDLRINSWGNAGIIGTGVRRQARIGTPEGWTIASIAAYRLRNKSHQFLCRLTGGLPSKKKTGDAEEARKAERQQQKDDEADAAGENEANGEGRNDLPLTVTSKDSRKVFVRFFGIARNVSWPGGTRVYTLDSGEKHEFKLTCQAGEKICYGAWRYNDGTVRWGAGRDGKDGCTQCCWACGSGSHQFTLSEGPDRPPPPPPNEVVFEIRSNDRFALGLEFYSRSYNRAWPGGDRMYTLKDSTFHRYSLNCTQGEQVCFGAWRDGNASKYWGVGRGGQQGCTACCRVCGTGTFVTTLSDGGESSPPVASSGGGGSALGSVLNGLAAGAAIGSAFRRSPTIRYSAPRQPPIYGRAPPQGQSDISGTR